MSSGGVGGLRDFLPPIVLVPPRPPLISPQSGAGAGGGTPPVPPVHGEAEAPAAPRGECRGGIRGGGAAAARGGGGRVGGLEGGRAAGRGPPSAGTAGSRSEPESGMCVRGAARGGQGWAGAAPQHGRQSWSRGFGGLRGCPGSGEEEEEEEEGVPGRLQREGRAPLGFAVPAICIFILIPPISRVWGTEWRPRSPLSLGGCCGLGVFGCCSPRSFGVGWCDPRLSLSRGPPGTAGEVGRLRPAGMEPGTEPPRSAGELCPDWGCARAPGAPFQELCAAGDRGTGLRCPKPRRLPDLSGSSRGFGSFSGRAKA